MTEFKTFDNARADFAPYGFSVELWQPAKLPRADRHAELEINYLSQGSLTYVYGGKRLTLLSKQFTIFWAAVPHQVVDFDQATPYFVITIPLRQAIDWKLPKSFLNALIHGQVLQDSATFDETDWRRLSTWHGDFKSGASARQEAMALELRARLLRLYHSWAAHAESSQSAKNAGVKDTSAHGTSLNASGAIQGAKIADQEVANDVLSNSRGPVSDSHKKAEAIVRYIAEHFQRKLSIAEIASSVGLHVEYATALFRRSFGTTMVDLITCYRVTHAQRLLVTTARPISEVASASGFETLSRFNSAFKQLSGTTPSAYRQTMGSYLKIARHT